MVLAAVGATYFLVAAFAFSMSKSLALFTPERAWDKRSDLEAHGKEFDSVRKE